MDQQKFRHLIQEYGVEEQADIATLRRYAIDENDRQAFISCKILPNQPIARKVWKEIQENKDILRTRYKVTRGQHEFVRGIIMGACGNGKTSLLNNICQSSQSAGQGMHSNTRNIVCLTVPYIKDEKFQVYDTPGTTSSVKISEHAALLRECLTHRPVNVIFLNLNYEKRGNQMINEMQSQITKIQKYEDHVVYLVSHADTADDLDKLIDGIYKTMQQNEMKQQVVFYSNKRCTRGKLAQLFYEIGTNLPSVQIQISEDEFLKNFRIGRIDSKFRKQFSGRLQKMEEMTNVYIKAAVDLKQDEEKEPIISEMALSLKDDLQKELKEFTEDARQLMLDYDYFGIYFALQKIVLDSDEKFNKSTRNFMSYTMLNSETKGQRQNVLDLLKQCPNCKEIWLRVEACPNTTCGNRPSDFWDSPINRASFKYHIVNSGTQIRITKRQIEPCQSAPLHPRTNREGTDIKYQCSVLRKEMGQLLKQQGVVTTHISKPDVELAKWVQICIKENERYLKTLLSNFGASIEQARRALLELSDDSCSETCYEEASQCLQFAKSQRSDLVEQQKKLDECYKRQLILNEKICTHRNIEADISSLQNKISTTFDKTRIILQAQYRDRLKCLESSKIALYDLVIKDKTLVLRWKNALSDIAEIRTIMQKGELEAREEYYRQLEEAQKCKQQSERLLNFELKKVLGSYQQTEIYIMEAQRLSLAMQTITLSSNLWKELIEFIPKDYLKYSEFQKQADAASDRAVHERALQANLQALQAQYLEKTRQLEKVEREIREGDKKGWVVGCGYPMNFRLLPRLPNIQQVLQQLYRVTSIEEIQIRLRADKDVAEARSNLEKYVKAQIAECENSSIIERQNPPN